MSWLHRSAAGTTTDVAPPWRGDEADLRAALDRHRAWTLLARRARDVPDLPPAVAADARRHRQSTFTHHLRVMADLRRCGSALTAAEVPWLCVKGPVLADLYRQRGDVRPYTDLDLLVPPAQMRVALRALEALGGQLLDRNFELMRRRLPGEMHLLAPGGTVVDLHWHLVNRSERRNDVRVTTDELLERAVPAGVEGGEAPTLHPADALAHLGLHAAGSGAGRGQWLLDVALTAAAASASGDAAARDPLWASVVARSRAWGVDRAVGVVLARVRDHLGAPVPDDAVTALLGPAWAAAERLSRRGSPLGASAPAWAEHTAVAAVEHRSLGAAIASRSVRRLSSSSRRPFVQGAGDPGSSLYPSGTAADLEHYLDAVVGGARDES